MAKSSPFSAPQPGICHFDLSLYETVTGLPVHLDEGTYESISRRGDILHYCQGLINQWRENEKFVTESFYSVLSGDRDLKDHAYNQIFLSIGKDIK